MFGSRRHQAGSSGSDSEIRRVRGRGSRAARACLSCRRRKVRCDVDSKRPQPCTNCTLDNVLCELAPRLPRDSNGSANSYHKSHRRDSLTSRVQVTQERSLPKPAQDTAMDGHNTAQSHTSGSFGNSSEGVMSPRQSSNPDSHAVDMISLQNHDDASPPVIAQRSSRVGAAESQAELLQQSALESSGSVILSTLTSGQTGASDVPALSEGTDDMDFLLHDWQNEVPDSEILARYMNLNDSFDLYIPEHDRVQVHAIEQDHVLNIVLPAAPVLKERASVFKSPIPWVSDWSVSHLENDYSWVKTLEEKVFSIPSPAEIETLIRLYFTYVQPRLPVLDEHEFYLLTTQDSSGNGPSAPKPISLAFLYAIMFSACPYLEIESPSSPHIASIRSRRCEFFSRAALLFKLDCEQNSLRKVQVCVLLSTYRSYPDHFYENERWTIAGYRILRDSGALPFNQTADPPSNSEWRRVSACWMHRFASLVVGLKWTSNSDLIESLSYSLPDFKIEDMKNDYSFSWYLSADAKHCIAQLFVASIDLHLHMVPLGKLLLKRTATDMELMGYERKVTRSLDPLSIEEVELHLETWKQTYTPLLTAEPPSSLTPLDVSVFRSDQFTIRCAYEYVLSTLYQSTLVMEGYRTTKWAAKIMEASRAALWESVSSTIDILRTMHASYLIHLLPSNSLVAVFIPVTILTLYIKQSEVYSQKAIDDVSFCSKIMQNMLARNDVAGFLNDLLSNCMALANLVQKMPERDLPFEAMARDNSEKYGQLHGADPGMLLPGPYLYSSVVRFQNLAWALGKIPPINLIITKGKGI